MSLERFWLEKGKCYVCGEPSLIGFHPLCLLKASIKGCYPRSTIRPTACVTCPFRKGTVWQFRSQIILNLLRIKKGTLQNCHYPPHPICAGAVMCSLGGNFEIMSPEEMRKVNPVNLVEVALFDL